MCLICGKKIRKMIACVFSGIMMFAVIGFGSSFAAKSDLASLPTQKIGAYKSVPTYAIQRFLYFYSYNCRSRIGIPDGVFGTKTKNAVIYYQDNVPLYGRDGVVGRETYTRINTHTEKYYPNYTGGYERWEKLDYTNTSSKVGIIQRGTTTRKWGTWNKSDNYIVM